MDVKRAGTACTTTAFKEKGNKYKLIVMMIVGQVSSKEEANEITFIAKLFVVGQRARDLARQNECEK